MTIEEIQQTLQTVAGNQARLTEAQIGYEARQARLDETVKQIAEAHKTLIELVRIQEERIDGQAEAHKTLIELVRIQEERIDGQAEARREADERLDALINAQVRYEARQERLEEAFRQVAASHAQLVEMLRLHEDRLDGQDEANVHTESRLDALIDAQIQLTQRVDTLTGDIAALNGRVDRIGAHLDQVAVLQSGNAEQIKALVAAQARTDKQIQSLFDRNGATKPRRKSPKAPKKKATKKTKGK